MDNIVSLPKLKLGKEENLSLNSSTPWLMSILHELSSDTSSRDSKEQDGLTFDINFTISGFANFPNILFKDYTELPLLVSHINSSANYIKENRDRIISLFSESSFFERLNILENKIFNEKS